MTLATTRSSTFTAGRLLAAAAALALGGCASTDRKSVV